MRTSSAFLTALGVVALALLAAGSASAIPSAPEIVVVPDSGAPGDPVAVSGTGFPPFSPVLIGFSQDGEDQMVGLAGTDDVGSFTALVAVPEDAVIGPALFFAGNTLASAEADFFVTGSEPIGDTPGPPADKVPVCEVVYILERVVNRLFTTDERFEFVHLAKPARPRAVVEVVAKGGEVTRVAEIIGRERRHKDAFPFQIGIHALVYVRDRLVGVVASVPKEVDCPGSVLFEFTEEEDAIIELKDRFPFGKQLGFLEVTYRVIVREVRAE